MSAAAGNVGFGFWSHDITGPGDDMELYTRWTQWGALSSIMRFHERGMSSGGCSKDVYPDPPGNSLSLFTKKRWFSKERMLLMGTV